MKTTTYLSRALMLGATLSLVAAPAFAAPAAATALPGPTSTAAVVNFASTQFSGTPPSVQTNLSNALPTPTALRSINAVNLSGAGYKRFAGSTRYGTSAAVAKSLCAGGCNKVYIASGTAYPDAITVSALAVNDDAAVLLVEKDSVPAEVEAVLRDTVRPSEITIAGGENSVSGGVAARLQEITGVKPARLAGENRYATANKIATRYGGGSTQNEVYLTTGTNWPDALAASSIAGVKGAPIVLSGLNQLGEHSRQALRNLQPDVVHIVGGSWATQTRNEISNLAGGADVRVYAGKDRYESAVRLAESHHTAPNAAVYVTGSTFADAISGSVLAAAADAPLLLVKQNCRTIETSTYTATVTGGAIVGGENSVSAAAPSSSCETVPNWFSSLRAILNEVGGAHVGLAEAGPNNCAADACSNSNGTIYVRPALGNYSTENKYWAMTHELAHQYQFPIMDQIQGSAGYANYFGGDIELLANCMAQQRGHGAGIQCTREQLDFSASIWEGRVP